MSIWEFDPAADGGWTSGACLSAPSQADIGQAFPLWKTWKGADRLCHALRSEGAALQVSGEDWPGLLGEIRRAEAHLEDTRPVAWRP